MNTEERNRWIAARLDEGLTLSDVQQRLADEHGITMTYLELRLLAADLAVDWQKQDPVPAPTPEQSADQDIAVEAEPTPAQTKVTISKLVRPGASISGDVEFASGAKAEWFVDAMGRLGLKPSPGSNQPSEQDIQEFQVELQRKLTGGGY